MILFYFIKLIYEKPKTITLIAKARSKSVTLGKSLAAISFKQEPRKRRDETKEDKFFAGQNFWAKLG